MATGLKMTHVPYKGSGPALTDLMGGKGPVVMFDNMPSSIGLVRSGSLKALAVTGPKREASAPNIPTVMESGYPDFNVVTWFGLFAPANTPKDVVNTLNKAVVDAVKSPEVNEQLKKLGATPTTTTPDEFRKIVISDRDRWAKVVKQADIKLN
jgi:tripartite-type tricarboxylate transporter receptor subunit TctC